MTPADEDTRARNKAVVRDHFEKVWSQGRLDLLESQIASDFRNFGQPASPADLGQIVERWRTASPDLRYTVDHLVAEGDQVVCHCTISGTQHGPVPLRAWATLPAPGRQFTVKQMHLVRLRDGKMVEHWAVRDDLGMLIQLGHVAIPQG